MGPTALMVAAVATLVVTRVDAVRFSQVQVIANDSYAFAHEGPVFHVASQSVFFSSNRIVDPADKSHQQIEYNRLFLQTNTLVKDVAPAIPMPNGATMSPLGKIVVCGQGNSTHPSGLYELDPDTLATRLLVDNWEGKPFNSLNDVSFDATHVWFTDVNYGHRQGFRPAPQLANFVYRARWNTTGDIFDVRPVVSDLVRPNGVVIHNNKLFVTDSGFALGDTVDPQGPRNVYEFSVGKHRKVLNQRLFASLSNGIPDGIHASGNVILTAGGPAGVVAYDIETGNVLARLVPEEGAQVYNFVLADTTIILMGEHKVYQANVHF